MAVATATQQLDPITFEVVRHRLWAINNEATATLKFVSGSPVATEVYDFNTSVLDARGQAIVVGPYIASHAICQGLVVETILKECTDNPGIREGDVFLCSDPYSGAIHQNDVAVVAPVFADGQLIAWTGATIHCVDVGGAFKGSQASETLHRVLTHTPTPLSVLREDVPPEVDAAITKAMAKSPDERFASAAAFIEALRAGRSRSEEQILEEFTALVAHDFQGDMPELLELESLDARDRAWRDAQDGPPTGRFSLTSSPPGPASNPPTVQDAVLPRVGPMSLPTQTLREDFKPFDDAEKPRRGAGLLWLAVGLGAVALAASLAFGFTLVRGAPAPQGSTRFLVIEKQSSDDSSEATAGPALAVASSATPAPATTEAASAGPAVSAAPTGKRGSGNDAAGLSRAFQRQQGRIEQCFQTHTKDVEGQPRIAVRFSIDKSGAVQSAELSPAALSGTPLGGCILAAARGTQFGAQSDALTFTIPITARRAK